MFEKTGYAERAGSRRPWGQHLEFEDFLDAHSVELARIAYLLTGDQARSDAIVTAVLDALWQDWQHIRATEGAIGFARRTLVAACLKRRPRATPDAEPALRVLLALPARRRACVVLVHALGLTANVAAACLGIGDRTASALATKGADRLRARLARQRAAAARAALRGSRRGRRTVARVIAATLVAAGCFAGTLGADVRFGAQHRGGVSPAGADTARP